MNAEIFRKLDTELASSDSKARKSWAQQVVDDKNLFPNLLSLLHTENRTAQRFMWLIGDICELDPDLVAPCMPFLFSLRNQMSFPGMPRSVAKWLGLTQVPKEIEKEATEQLFCWLGDTTSSIGCKSYSAKALHGLAQQGRIETEDLRRVVKSQTTNPNPAFSSRMKKLLGQL